MRPACEIEICFISAVHRQRSCTCWASRTRLNQISINHNTVFHSHRTIRNQFAHVFSITPNVVIVDALETNGNDMHCTQNDNIALGSYIKNPLDCNCSQQTNFNQIVIRAVHTCQSCRVLFKAAVVRT